MPDILTERLRMNALWRADAPALFGYRSDSEVKRFQSWAPETVDDAFRFIEELGSVSFDTAGTWYQLGVRLRETDQLIGDLGVHFIADDSDQVEIAFTISPNYQRRGYGFEAVSGLLEYVFGQLRKHRAFASVDPRNNASLGLLRRIGMRQEAHFRESVLFRGEWADDVVFGMLASEWNAHKG